MTRRLLALLAVLGLVTAACGSEGTTDAGPVPERPTTTAAPTATPSTTAAPGGTTAPAGTAETSEVSVWLARNELLEPVPRTVPRVARIGAEAVKALLAGPTAAETREGYSTAVPKETRFLDLVIDANGIAKVDLSRDFESGGGSLGLTLRLAQVTCTVGQFPSVKGVRFALAGELVSVFSGNGIVLDRPVTCDSYREVLRTTGDAAASVGIWPFATRADITAYEGGTDRTFTEPLATARAFATRYLGFDNPVDFGFKAVGTSGGEVPMGFRYGEGRTPVANPQVTFTVALRQYGGSGTSGYWTVVEVRSPAIVVTSPKMGEQVGSPVRLTGSAHTFEGNVTVQVRQAGQLAGQSLGKGFVTGGGDMLRPFTGQIAFSTPSKPDGAIVLFELSAADGQSILRAAVVWVRF